MCGVSLLFRFDSTRKHQGTGGKLSHQPLSEIEFSRLASRENSENPVILATGATPRNSVFARRLSSRQGRDSDFESLSGDLSN